MQGLHGGTMPHKWPMSHKRIIKDPIPLWSSLNHVDGLTTHPWCAKTLDVKHIPIGSQTSPYDGFSHGFKPTSWNRSFEETFSLKALNFVP
jgi:hypothetical protein